MAMLPCIMSVFGIIHAPVHCHKQIKFLLPPYFFCSNLFNFELHFFRDAWHKLVMSAMQVSCGYILTMQVVAHRPHLTAHTPTQLHLGLKYHSSQRPLIYFPTGTELIVAFLSFVPSQIQWLLENYETAEGVSLPRCTLYNHYLRHCAANKIDAVNAASFGKLIRSVFIGLKTRRLGTR